MKYIVERSGSYTTTTYVWQKVEIDADSFEEAEELAWNSDDVRVLRGDDGGWDYCDDREVSEVLSEEEYYARQQLSHAARFSPVFEQDDQRGK